jgi:hypothetical protein
MGVLITEVVMSAWLLANIAGRRKANNKKGRISFLIAQQNNEKKAKLVW